MPTGVKKKKKSHLKTTSALQPQFAACYPLFPGSLHFAPARRNSVAAASQKNVYAQDVHGFIPVCLLPSTQAAKHYQTETSLTPRHLSGLLLTLTADRGAALRTAEWPYCAGSHQSSRA